MEDVRNLFKMRYEAIPIFHWQNCLLSPNQTLGRSIRFSKKKKREINSIPSIKYPASMTNLSNGIAFLLPGFPLPFLARLPHPRGKVVTAVTAQLPRKSRGNRKTYRDFKNWKGYRGNRSVL
jgi:hypothetical protein